MFDDKSTAELIRRLVDTQYAQNCDVQFINNLLDELKSRINNCDWPFGYSR